LHEGAQVSLAPRSKDAPVPHSVIIVATETRSRNIFYRIEGRVGADDRLPDESIIRFSTKETGKGATGHRAGRRSPRLYQ
jgi:hypothetical protein